MNACGNGSGKTIKSLLHLIGKAKAKDADSSSTLAKLAIQDRYIISSNITAINYTTIGHGVTLYQQHLQPVPGLPKSWVCPSLNPRTFKTFTAPGQSDKGTGNTKITHCFHS